MEGKAKMEGKMDLSTKIELNNGVKMPIFGLGTYQMKSVSETRLSVLAALDAGYRLIDTAAIYDNEYDVGVAINQSGIPRDEIFLTTKLWNTDQGFDQAIKACESSLKRLDVSYVDLYLIHWPLKNRRLESWRALEQLYNDGKCRAIGVSNFTINHLSELLDVSIVTPAINQVEFSPYTYQADLLHFCNDNGIQLEAYSPLTKGIKLQDPRLLRIALKYSKTPSQILLRWSIQTGVIVVCKSIRKERIIENANIFDFKISDKDMKRLDALDEDLRTSWDPNMQEWD